MLRTCEIQLRVREMSGCCTALLLLLIVAGVASAEEHPLNRFVHHYEPLNYDEDDLMYHHHRVRQALIGPREISLKFGAFDRHFDLLLEPETDLFHREFKLTTTGNLLPENHGVKSWIYSGYARDDPDVKVHGHVFNGVFEGSISTSDESFHIEPATRYFDEPTAFHSIIYRRSDVDTSVAGGPKCGSDHETQQHLTKLHIRKERSIHLEERQTTRNQSLVLCPLIVIGDYKFFSEVTDDFRSNDDRVMQAAALLINFIRDASRIFEETDFDGVDGADGIGFSIRILVIENIAPDPADPFSNEFIGVEAFLNLHSEANWEDFCLSYRFTYRDFDGGLLGLAYIAAQPGSGGGRGGICEEYVTFSGGVMKTLNTGVVTLLNYGQRVPSIVTSLTFAHQVGHSFGSQHDPEDDPDCAPSSSNGGKYIMYGFATGGEQTNNDKFSPCSRSMMDSVISVRGQGSDGCLLVQGDNCGNGVIDDGEQCDCGFASITLTGVCANDPCCNETSCTITKNMECSPMQGPCCDSQMCTFMNNTVCSEETMCAELQTCNGTSTVCPDLIPKEPEGNGADSFILCNDGANVCDNGMCTGSVCTALDLASDTTDITDCECSNVEESCHICCLIDGMCISTIAIAADPDNPFRELLPEQMGRYHIVGFPCGDFTGYCDFFNRCMTLDSGGLDVDCGTLMNPDNGQVNFTDTTLGADATYTCNEGFPLDGVDTRTCEANGNWSDSEPTCGVEIARLSLLVMTLLVITVLGSAV